MQSAPCLSRAPIVVCVDDDTEFDENLIYNHLVALKEHGVDCISGAVFHKHVSTIGNSEYRKVPDWECGVYTLFKKLLGVGEQALARDGTHGNFARADELC